LYQSIERACNEQQPEENRYYQSSECYPDFYMNNALRSLQKASPKDRYFDSCIRGIARALYSNPIHPNKRKEYYKCEYDWPSLESLFPSIDFNSISFDERKKYLDELDEMSRKETQQIYEMLTNDIEERRNSLSSFLDSKNSAIRDWIKLYFQVSGQELARLEAGVIREYVIARNNRLSHPDYQARHPKEPTAISFGDGRFQIDGKELRLDYAEAITLEALVRRKSASKSDLFDDTGIEDPGRKLKRICEKHPNFSLYIKLPGRKGRGGYTTRIELAEELDAS
jgi:hypothetical protein